jgi:hypothetical protein
MEKETWLIVNTDILGDECRGLESIQRKSDWQELTGTSMHRLRFHLQHLAPYLLALHHKYIILLPNRNRADLDKEKRVLREIEMSPHHASCPPETSRRRRASPDHAPCPPAWSSSPCHNIGWGRGVNLGMKDEKKLEDDEHDNPSREFIGSERGQVRSGGWAANAVRPWMRAWSAWRALGEPEAIGWRDHIGDSCHACRRAWVLGRAWQQICIVLIDLPCLTCFNRALRIRSNSRGFHSFFPWRWNPYVLPESLLLGKSPFQTLNS